MGLINCWWNLENNYIHIFKEAQKCSNPLIFNSVGVGIHSKATIITIYIDLWVKKFLDVLIIIKPGNYISVQ